MVLLASPDAKNWPCHALNPLPPPRRFLSLGLFSFRLKFRHFLPRVASWNALCPPIGTLTTGGCQPFNLAWRHSASSRSTNFVLIAWGRCNLDDWIGLKRRCTRREDILKPILVLTGKLYYYDASRRDRKREKERWKEKVKGKGRAGRRQKEVENVGSI